MFQICRSLVLMVLICLSLRGGLCFADISADAHLRKGVSFLAKNQDQPALEEFRKAYALVPSAQAAAQMGLAERSLEMWLDAERHLTEALSSTAEPWIERNRFHLEEQLTQVASHLGSVRVDGPRGCTVQVNGIAVAQLPMVRPLRVAIGEVMVGCLCADAQPQRQRAIVVGSKTIDVAFDEPRIAVTKPAAPPAPVSAAVPAIDAPFEKVTVAAVPRAVNPVVDTAASSMYSDNYVGWNKALLVSAILFGTAGTVVNTWDVMSRKENANSGLGYLMGSVVLNEVPLTLGGLWLYRFSEHQNHGKLRVGASIINVIATVGLTTAGTLILTGEKQHKEDNKGLAWASIGTGAAPLAMVLLAAVFSEPATATTVALLPTSSGLSLAGRF